jgi:McrBC 5-methylcytosine restriction system component
MLLYAWNEPSLGHQVDMGDVENAPTVDALFAIVLIKLIGQRMRVGLGHGYVPTSKQLRAVRGRVRLTGSMLDQFARNGEVECDFQQYSVNEPRNQIIRSTLARIVQVGEFGPDKSGAESLRHKLRWLVRNLSAVEMIELSPESIRRQMLAQNDNDYRLMLSICELLLMRWMPVQGPGTHPLPHLERDLLILHRVYERFVAGFYRMRLKGWDVHAQKRLDWHAQEVTEHLPSMVPDLVLRNKETGGVIILDTKFTAGSLVDNQWGKPVYDSSHLYQLYAYLRSQEEVSSEHRSAMGILLYPVIRARLSESIQLQGHLIRIECVDLAAEWEEVERQLLALVG